MPQAECSIPKAKALFLRSGYHGSTIAKLAQELGVSARALYVLYGGKRGLLLQAIKTESAEWEQLLTRAHDRHPGHPREALKEFIDELQSEQMSRSLPTGSFLANITGEIESGDREVQAAIAGQYDHISKSIAGIVEKINDGHASITARPTALFILAAIEGSILLARADNDFWEMKNGFTLLKDYIDGL
jgi:AcrR family transcriptional regulator